MPSDIKAKMPPTKKRKLNPALSSERPGIAKQHLLDHYSDVPVLPNNLLNGHVLFLYINNEKNLSKTGRAAIKSISQHEQHLPSDISSNLTYAVQRLVKCSLDKFRKLSDRNEFKKFENICSEQFKVPLVSHDRTKSTKETIAAAEESTSIPPRQPVCHRCKILKERLRTAELKKKSLMLQLHKQRKQMQPVKVMSQKLKRKCAQLEKCKQQQNDLEATDRIAQMQQQIANMNRNHKRLKQYHKHKSGRTIDKSNDTVKALKNRLETSMHFVEELEDDAQVLQEQVEDLQKENDSTPSHLLKEGKTYPTAMRLLVFDCIINQVPTSNIPVLVKQFGLRFGIPMVDIPHRNTIEMMARELGVIAELQTAEVIMANNNSTIGFDATTQEGTHINSIHITSQAGCHVVAVDELPGGTAQDYAEHICDSIDHLAEIYCTFHDNEYVSCRKEMIDHIANSMTDRCAANHAAIREINQAWGKSLNELNCHLHPLDTIASSTRSALGKVEKERGSLYGKDCHAGNIILQMNKLRFKDGKGDPRGFITFLADENLPKGIIVRYRGNRLHILFHLAGIYFEHHATFLRFLRTGTGCGGLRASLMRDFQIAESRMELQVLGLLGKLLTGPWMVKFYTSADTQISHLDCITEVSKVIEALKVQQIDPAAILCRKVNFFGHPLDDADSTIQQLQQTPLDVAIFSEMVKVCLQATIDVLERQYKRYFQVTITAELQEETRSAKSHNIDAEEIMGMYSAAQQRAPNATICFLSSKLRAQKNRTVQYLDSLNDQKKVEVMKMAIKEGRKQRHSRKKHQAELCKELSKRQAKKRQDKETAQRKKLEKKIKSMDVKDIAAQYPDMDHDRRENLLNLLEGKTSQQDICHLWSDGAGGLIMYNGKIEKAKQKSKYKVAYWSQDEDYSNAVDFDMSKYELATDLILGDLVM